MVSDSFCRFLKESSSHCSPSMIAFAAALEQIRQKVPVIAQSIIQELRDQRQNLKLIASENYCSLTTQLAMGNWLTDKYAEGFPGHRFYAGCDNIDAIESFASAQACQLFGCDYAYIQPHSGADANLIAYWAILHQRIQLPESEKIGETNFSKMSKADWDRLRHLLGNQRLLGLDYYSGGHLTHGYRYNISAQMFDAYSYTVDPQTGLLNYDEIARLAREIKPLILLAGYSAYPRKINFAKMREIAEDVGAVLMVDMAHFAGLVAGKVFVGEYNPIPYAHLVTTTTHKTLRGPRGGLVLCQKEFIDAVNKGCPLVIGGPLPHVMAAKAIALAEANTPEFQNYAHRIVENAQTMAEACMRRKMIVATGGTDNHLFLIDVRPFGINGRQAEMAIRQCGITLNRNSLPFDPNGPWYTSGLRIGTPAVTTLGMGKEEMEEIADILYLILSHTRPAIQKSGKEAGQPSKSKIDIPESIVTTARNRVRDLLSRYPVYPELDLETLSQIVNQPSL